MQSAYGLVSKVGGIDNSKKLKEQELEERNNWFSFSDVADLVRRFFGSTDFSGEALLLRLLPGKKSG